MAQHAYIAIGIAMVAQASAAMPFDLVNIGDPGNRNTIPEEVPRFPNPIIGGVDYEFRITRSPVTVEQWFEFVDAYKDFTDVRDQTFIGSGSFVRPDGTIISIRPPQSAVEVSWQYAARYMNWLHNGRQNTEEAFESGVYDTSTFGTDENGNYTDQRDPSQGAQFWLPTWDEWAKAVYYDPDRYGPNDEGYWLHPDGGNDPLIPGLPEDGGETDASGVPDSLLPLDVGAYSGVLTPYGLLDVSGGVHEFISGSEGNEQNFALRISSDRGNSGTQYVNQDRLDRAPFPAFPNSGLHGFRVATVIPSPGVFPLFGGVVFLWSLRRRDV